MRLAGAVLAAVLAPAAALAHPLDEVVQGSYLTLAPGQVTLQLDISPGALVADSVLRRLTPTTTAGSAAAKPRPSDASCWTRPA